MAKKETTKKETSEKKTRAPRKSTKKAEVIPAVEEEILEKPAETKISFTKIVKIATVLPQEGLKIRKGPGVDFDKYAGVKIPAGTEVDVLEEKDGFVRIGYDQWVMKNYLGGI